MGEGVKDIARVKNDWVQIPSPWPFPISTFMKIAFDIDDTLIIPSVVTGNRDVPNFDTIAIYRWFQAQGHEMFLWS